MHNRVRQTSNLTRAKVRPEIQVRVAESLRRDITVVRCAVHYWYVE